MPRRWMNAAVGYVMGSLAYFLFLIGAFVLERSGSWRMLAPAPGFPAIRCSWGSPFWYRIISEAGLSHRLQPHLLYLFSLIGALALARIQRPFHQDLPLSSPRFAGLAGVLSAAIALHLWFSVSNLFPGRYGL